MRIIFSFFLLISINSILLNCTTTPKEGIRLTLIKNGELLNFPLDSLTPNYTIPDGCSSVKLNRKDILVYYNRLQNTLLFFDIESGKLIHSIKYIKQGIYPVNHIDGIEVISKDSIFLAPAYIKRLYLSDWNGKINKVYDLQKDPNIEKNWQNEPFGKLDIVDNTCIFETIPIGDQNKPRYFFKVPLGAAFHLSSEKMAINFIHYPDVYQHDEKWGFYHAMSSQCVNRKGDIIISFPLDPNVYVYDKKCHLINSFLASSEYLSDHIPPFKDVDDTEKYCYNNDKYEQIMYDKFRDVYYRFATKGVEGKEPPMSKLLYKGLFKPLYVIILDKYFKKIGEIELPRNKYYFMNSFIAEKGLYISNSHPNNINMRENQIGFSCYELAHK